MLSPMRLPCRVPALIALLSGVALCASSMPAATATPVVKERAWYGLPTTITLTTPQVYVGVPVTFTATLSNTVVSGTATFWVNDPIYGLAPSVPVVNGKATLTWLPGYTWIKNWQVYGVSFSPNPQQGTTSAEVANPPMSVLPNRGSDPVTFTAPAGMRAGTSVAMTVATGSGSAVALSSSGPCSLSGVGTNSATLTASGAGSCVVTAVSNGGNGFVGAQSSTTVAIAAVPARTPVKKPAKKR